MRDVPAWAGALFVGSALVAFVANWEGKRNVAYEDVGGKLTVCYGHTAGVKKGDKYTDAQCLAMLKADIAEHRAGVLECLQAPVNENQLDSLTSLAFNLGVQAACNSTPMLLFNAGDYSAACSAFLSYSGVWTRDKDGNKISYRTYPGLLKRRQAEQIWCLTPSTGLRGSSLLQYLQTPDKDM